MDIPLLIAVLLLIGCAMFIILYPLWQQSAAKNLDTDSPLKEYQVKYHALLADIKELTFDYEMDKVSTPDYNILLLQLKQEAAKVRQQIDQLGHSQSPKLEAQLEALISQTRSQSSNGSAKDSSLYQEIEAELSMLKDNQQQQHCTSCQQPLQPNDAFCRQCGQPVAQPEPISQPCPQCGQPTIFADAFCASCGTKILQSQDTQ